MAANTAPIFLATPKKASARISAANTARDGSGSLVTLYTAGSNGSRIDYIVFTNSATSIGAAVAKVYRVFVSDTSGANPRILQEATIAAVTSSATVAGQTVTISFTNGLMLASGQIVYVTQSLCATSADQTDVFAQGGDY